MMHSSWFIPLCVAVSIIFAISILILTISTLSFRSKVNKQYDRGKLDG